QVYTLYTWFLWPVLIRSTARQLSGHGSWAKTAREPIADLPEPAGEAAGPPGVASETREPAGRVA
ncbi:MAG: hypothetical protein JST53_06365, partial [Actinobacteria bacterium]|nr:hypothetical protein [Actinomycetota bacterium]